MKKQILGLVLVAVLSSACLIKNVNTNEQGQGQSSGTGPSDTPSPTQQCALVQIDAGTVGDVTQIARGATVAVGVSLIGPQGLELADLCVAQYQARWSGGSPCGLTDNGFTATLTAPSAAPIGAICRATVHVGSKTDSVDLEVQ